MIAVLKRYLLKYSQTVALCDDIVSYCSTTYFDQNIPELHSFRFFCGIYCICRL